MSKVFYVLNMLKYLNMVLIEYKFRLRIIFLVVIYVIVKKTYVSIHGQNEWDGGSISHKRVEFQTNGS